MSEDLIKRSDAAEVVYKALKTPPLKGVLTDNMSLAIALVRDIPSADRPQGKWILSDLQSQADNDNGNYAYVCTNCNHTDIHAKTQEVPFCWWCGAKMK